jgi:nicotinate-nucleotide adenylyltransferase
MPEPAAASRIAFFGGTFDPPHLGHLAVARAACSALALDQVLFAPVGAQPLKPLGAAAPFADRVAMTRLAIAGDPAFAVSMADAPAADGAPNYTIDTLMRLRSEFASAAELFCLVGADSFLTLHHWHRAAEIPFVAPLIVASRPGESLDRIATALPAGLSIEPVPAGDCPQRSEELRCFRLRNSAGATAPFFLLPSLNIEISATAIRQHAGGSPDGAALPPAVAQYIRDHHLYR